MGMSDYYYEEAVKYRYEYWEREGWLKSCLEILERNYLDPHSDECTWDIIDTVAMVVGLMDGSDGAEIALARRISREDDYNSMLYYDYVRKVIQKRLDYTREEIEEAEKVIEDY